VFTVHRVYIYSDVNPHSIMQQYDQVERDNNTNPTMSHGIIATRHAKCCGVTIQKKRPLGEKKIS
jgi:hypothetical protein